MHCALPSASNGTASHPDKEFCPSIKLIVPDGATPITVAVNVTAAPRAAGFKELSRDTTVTGAMVCSNALLLEGA